MSTDPGENNKTQNESKEDNNNNVIVKYPNTQQTINNRMNNNSNNINNENIKSCSSTSYGGVGATPNSCSNIQIKKKQTLDLNRKSAKIDFEDELGPIVLNIDGTISRIKNWHKLTKMEQDKIRDKICKRNAKRRLVLQQKQ
eukprot:874036_1